MRVCRLSSTNPTPGWTLWNGNHSLVLVGLNVGDCYNVPQAGEVFLGSVGARGPAVQIEHFHLQTLNFGASNGVSKVLQRLLLSLHIRLNYFKANSNLFNGH